ncbi:hypothetical protein [Vacuolonema iberomarrocanum]|uniref:hypothetical protein n=1 Tax=Vacuolonema iberomarrocanum TaxID=3454632 RepID=UPI0019E41044|nr:DUF2281 domain-containing protein [filamentous cyanobacterium LEGE 07170]
MTLQDQIIQEIEQVPDSLLEEILDFILFTKGRRQLHMIHPTVPDRADDPLVDFVGAVNAGNLAQGIDETLYE